MIGACFILNIGPTFALKVKVYERRVGAWKGTWVSFNV